MPSTLSTLFALQGLLALSLAQTPTGQLGDAAQNTKNPPSAAYVAELTEGPIKGRILAINAQDKGTAFSVRFDNMPQEGGPFPYHIHVAAVPESNNCTETLAHLDPYIRGEDVPCQQDRPETCQVGDLAGKHGKIEPQGPGNVFEASFTDPYVSLVPGEGSFFGNRSFVIHYANKTRITCANFISADKAFADLGPDEMPANWPNGWPRPNSPTPPPGEGAPTAGGRGDVPGGGPQGGSGGPGMPLADGKPPTTETGPAEPQASAPVPAGASTVSSPPPPPASASGASTATVGSAKQQEQAVSAASRPLARSLFAVAVFMFAAIAL